MKGEIRVATRLILSLRNCIKSGDILLVVTPVTNLSGECTCFCLNSMGFFQITNITLQDRTEKIMEI